MTNEPDSIRVMRSPRTVGIELTSRCNLRCSYCSFFNNPAVSYEDLTTEEWLSFFDELGNLRVMEVILAGGEPFVREDLPALVEGIVRNGMRFSFLSNGSLITKEIAAFLANTGRCNYVQVSVDGSNPNTHDACRGRGSFDGAINGIRTLQSHGINVAARITIHRNNVHDLENTVYLLLEDLGLPGLGTNSVGYLGMCRQNARQVMLTTEDRQNAMVSLLRLNEKYQGRISAMAGPLADARNWRRMEDARAKNEPAFRNGGHLTACGCPSHTIAVRADGAIVPCSMLPHIELGRINQVPLARVWQHSSDLNRMRRRKSIELSTFEFCANCPYVQYCTGNCPGLAYTLTGQVDHPSPDACLRRFLENGGRMS